MMAGGRAKTRRGSWPSKGCAGDTEQRFAIGLWYRTRNGCRFVSAGGQLSLVQLSAQPRAAAVARNIEIKARLSSEAAQDIRKRALARSSLAPEVVYQRDTFYSVPSGRLKLREFKDGTAELIAYERPDRAGPKHSSYVLSPCADPKSLHAALARSIGIRGVVEKHRQVIHVGQTRVHLDEVVGLGSFLELEVVLREDQSPEEGKAIAAELMAAFEVTEESLIDGAYIDLLEGVCLSSRVRSS